jgi:dihydrofolate reductase
VSVALPLVIVVAVARNGIIGGDNRLLWRLKSDLKRFRALTIGKPLIMGRKTYQSIGKALPGRRTIVLTRDPAFVPEDADVARDAPAAIAMAGRAGKALGAKETIIAGGGDIYRLFLPQAARAHLTLVEAEPRGDATFPWPMPPGWRETARQSFPADFDHDHAYAFIDFERR